MSERNDGGPAFPNSIAVGPAGDVAWSNEGLSIRDYFAAQALTAIITANGIPYANDAKWQVLHATWAYGHADAMIQHREKEAAP